jgi:hypothetical protein
MKRPSADREPGLLMKLHPLPFSLKIRKP